MPPLTSLTALERVLDLCIDKDFVYNLSESKRWNARRYTSLVIAHVRHRYSEYDDLLSKEGVERFEARRRTAEKVWKILEGWRRWAASNEILERCFQATLLRPEERDPEFADDPMDIDSDGEMGIQRDVDDAAVEDPMDLD